jgi:transposase
VTLPPLPDDLNELKRMVIELVARINRSEVEQARLRELLEAKRERHSEKLSEGQLALFAAMWEARQEEAKAAAEDDDDAEPPASATGVAPTPKRKRTGRPALPKDLPRQIIEHDVASKDEPCADCHAPLRLIGADRSERLEVIPAQMKVVEEVCFKYACQCSVHTATKPAQPLPKSSASASVLAHVITAKFLYHLPLHRQEQMWAAQGVTLSRKTMSGWLAPVADLLKPVYEALKQHVFGSHVLGTDDTGVKVLDPNLSFARKGHFWPYCGDRGHPGVVFQYTATRGGKEVAEFLRDYRGPYLQADAYSAYDALYRDRRRGLREVGCFAHCRRYWMKALDTAQDQVGPVLHLIHRLYQVEAEARELDEVRRLALRQERSRPLLDQLRAYLDDVRLVALPQSPAGKAVRYTLNQWIALTRFCDDGALAIDNNATERALRGIAV